MEKFPQEGKYVLKYGFIFSSRQEEELEEKGTSNESTHEDKST